MRGSLYPWQGGLSAVLAPRLSLSVSRVWEPLGDLGASFLVIPPGVDTLSLLIFELLHSGREFKVAGICLALALLLAAVAGVAIWLVGRWGRGTAAE